MQNRKAIRIARTEIDDPIFQDLFQALRFYNLCNPARYKRTDPTEVNSGSARNHHDPLDSKHPHRIWAAVAACIHRTLDELAKGSSGWRKARAFRLYHIGSRDECLSKHDIAQRLHCSQRTVHRDIAEGEDILYRDLVREYLLRADTHRYFDERKAT